MGRYFEDFGSWESVRDSFRDQGSYNYETREYGTNALPSDFPTDEQVLFAAYGGSAYEGHATVIFRDAAGDLKIVDAGHCSCNGLEGQWEPSETTAAALGMRSLNEYDYDEETRKAFREMFPAPPAKESV
jgi:hypothetical protein